MTPDNCPDVSLEHASAVFVEAALRAGAKTLRFWRKGTRARSKADGSPVTEADLAANAIILAALEQAFPWIPVVSEESDKPPNATDAGLFILVDPLDGTREFLAETDEFTVNVALIRDGAPICGVVYAPAMGRIWRGDSGGAFGARVDMGACDSSNLDWQTIACRAAPDEPVAVVSRSHLNAETLAWLAEQGIERQAPSGSSIKFCLLAEGAADVYPRFSRTMEWDTAAGDAVLRAAGGGMTDLSGNRFVYGKSAEGYANTGFIARGA